MKNGTTFILNKKPVGDMHSTGINIHGSTEPTQKLIDFCGQDVLDALEHQLREKGGKSTMVYFQKGDRKFHVWKGIAGRIGYNVYEYIETESVASEKGKRKTCEKETSMSIVKHGINISWGEDTQSDFHRKLDQPINKEEDFFEYIMALYEEWKDRARNGYPAFEALSHCFQNLNRELPPHAFCGDIKQ